MWSAALCTLGVTKPLWDCTCLNVRQGGVAAESRGTRPLKIWDSWRNVRKGLVVSSFEELLIRGRDKLGVSALEPVRIVLESDGTQIEDGEYFRTLANNTILLLLRQGERWYPTGVDVIKAAIPKIVCETIHALELHDETPSWKIMDNKGRVTVVLHWDQRQGGSAGTNSINGITQGFSSISCGGGGGGLSNTNGLSSDKYSPSKKGVSAQNSLDKSSVTQPQRYPSPQITVINHDDMQSNIYHTSSSLASINRRLSKGLGGGGSGAGSFDSTIGGGAVHVHTPECAHHVHTPHSRAGSPSAIECDFHCCSLHEEGRQIAVHKNVATSPIQDGMGGSPQPSYTGNLSDSSCTGGGGGGGGLLSSGRRSSSTKGHVRFLNVGPDRESSESETDNTALEDEFMQTEKYLLLVDQLSVDQKRHLSIKDIGIILERLSAKIVDVERLERECDADDSYNWTIKTTIRGDSLNDLGIIYNSNYYSISEHPGYKEENRVANQSEEPEERL